MKYHCYLAISLNEHAWPASYHTKDCSNQSKRVRICGVELSEVVNPPLCGMCVLCFNLMATAKKKKKKATVFQEFWRFCLDRSSHCSRNGALWMIDWSLVIRVCLYYTHSLAWRSNSSLKGTVKQRIKFVFIWGYGAQYFDWSKMLYLWNTVKM